MKQTYTTVTNPTFYDTLRADAAQGETNWTINPHARRGDTVLLYVCAPIMAIVATATLSTDAELLDDISSDFFGAFVADMHGLRLLEKPLTRAEMMRRLPEWGWPRQPRQSVRVPEEFRPQLERLLR